MKSNRTWSSTATAGDPLHAHPNPLLCHNLNNHRVSNLDNGNVNNTGAGDGRNDCSRATDAYDSNNNTSSCTNNEDAKEERLQVENGQKMPSEPEFRGEFIVLPGRLVHNADEERVKAVADEDKEAGEEDDDDESRHGDVELDTDIWSSDEDDCVYAYRGDNLDEAAHPEPLNVDGEADDDDETDFLEMDFDPEPNSEQESVVHDNSFGPLHPRMETCDRMGVAGDRDNCLPLQEVTVPSSSFNSPLKQPVDFRQIAGPSRANDCRAVVAISTSNGDDHLAASDAIANPLPPAKVTGTKPKIRTPLNEKSDTPAAKLSTKSNNNSEKVASGLNSVDQKGQECSHQARKKSAALDEEATALPELMSQCRKSNKKLKRKEEQEEEEEAKAALEAQEKMRQRQPELDESLPQIQIPTNVLDEDSIINSLVSNRARGCVTLKICEG